MPTMRAFRITRNNGTKGLAVYKTTQLGEYTTGAKIGNLTHYILKGDPATFGYISGKMQVLGTYDAGAVTTTQPAFKPVDAVNLNSSSHGFFVDEVYNGKTYRMHFVTDSAYAGAHLYCVYNVTDGMTRIEGPYLEFTTIESNDELYKATVTQKGPQYNPTKEDKSPDATYYTEEQFADDFAIASQGYLPTVESITRWPSSMEGKKFDIFSSRPIIGVFGSPYQFMPHVDPRIVTDDISDYSGYVNSGFDNLGKTYARKIVENMPILFLSPGVPNFMGSYSDEEKNSIFGSLASLISGGGTVSTDQLLSDTGKYYTFEYNVADYYNHVNPLCRLAANFLGIGDYKLDDTRLDTVDWSEYTTKTLNDFFNGIVDPTEYMSIPFYIESDTQFSESFGNDVGASSIAGMADQLSDAAKEAMFFLGYSQMAQNVAIAEFDSDTGESALSGLLDNVGGATSSKFIQNVFTNLSSVATGGKLIFPKIWKDSSFSHSYEVTIKLRSPDMDTVSVFLNVIVPFLHLFGFTVPRQIENNPNGLRSPFLVRGIYKGHWTVDMGIVTGMSVTRGDSGMWNADGIPSAIDVNLSIVDLYENIAMTKGNDLKYDTLDNTTLMDYIANLCGVNIYTPEVGRTIRMWIATNFENRFKDFVRIGVWSNLLNSVANAISSVWRPNNR